MSLLRRTHRSDLDWPDWPSWPTGRRLFELPESWAGLFEDAAMKIEEFREDDVMVVRVELPGIDPERDVEITVSDGVVRISAERREETRSEDTQGYRSEFRYGTFTRTSPLPAGADEESVTATYEDGILEVRIPVSDEAAKAKKVPVTKR
jgi:HSP20 family protein